MSIRWKQVWKEILAYVLALMSVQLMSWAEQMDSATVSDVITSMERFANQQTSDTQDAVMFAAEDHRNWVN